MAGSIFKQERLSTIVVGGLNTDIIAQGVPSLVAAGELAQGGQLVLGPGGKSRNMAQMIASLRGPSVVAMIGKTAEDPWGLWRIPLQALRQAGVDTSYVTVLPLSAGQMPSVALIPVDRSGKNQIYVLPGVNAAFSKAEIDAAEPLFVAVSRNKGALVLSLECPLETVLYALQKANKVGLLTLVDPGGIDSSFPIARESGAKGTHPLLQQDIDLLKPNEHETKILTGVEVHNLESARQASNILFAHNVKRVLITCGANGAYFLSRESRQDLFISTPEVKADKATCDETGCGDQAMAALVAGLQMKMSWEDAARLAIVAGTMQFQRRGIVPISKDELPDKKSFAVDEPKK
jgi:ribokinase